MQRMPEESLEAYKLRRAYQKDLDRKRAAGVVITSANSFNREKQRALEFKADKATILKTNIDELIRFADNLKIKSTYYKDLKALYLKYKNCSSITWLENMRTDMTEAVKDHLPKVAEV